MSRYAISDIHGCSKTFRYMTGTLLQLKPGDALYLLGDYIDRGPGSKDVIDHIFELEDSGVIITALRGNHEDMFLKAIAHQGEPLDHWLRNGGDATLKSFNLHTIEEVATLSQDSFDKRYIDFFRSLEYYKETTDFFLVHAGFNFGIEDPFSDHYSMMWIRNMKESSIPGNKRIIHGHTPRTIERIQESLDSKLINIDGGCVYKGTGTGHLVALNLDLMEITFTLSLD